MQLRVRWMVLACAATLAVSGCGPSPMSGSWRTVDRAGPVNGDDQTSLPTPPAKKVVELPDDLRLADAIVLAMQHHPELAAFSAARRAREAEIVQASVLPNPELEFEIEEILGSGGRSGFDAAEYSLRFVQLFERGDKRRLRETLAERMADEAELEYVAARTAVAAGVTRAFVETLLAQERLSLEREHLEFVARLRSVIERRIEAGAASPVDRHRAVVEESQVRAKVTQAARLVEMHQRLVPYAVGLMTGDAASVAGELDRVTEPITRDRIEQLVRATPELERWLREIARRRAEVELARANAVPDLRAGAGVHYFSEPSDFAFSVGVSIPLMIFDRNEGMINSREWDVTSALERSRASELSLLAAATRLHAEIEAAFLHVRAIEQDILPAAERATRDMETAFAEGKVDLLNVLDTQRTLFEIRDELLEARARYHIGVAELDGLLGRFPTEPESESESTTDGEQE